MIFCGLIAGGVYSTAAWALAGAGIGAVTTAVALSDDDSVKEKPSSGTSDAHSHEDSLHAAAVNHAMAVNQLTESDVVRILKQYKLRDTPRMRMRAIDVFVASRGASATQEMVKMLNLKPGELEIIRTYYGKPDTPKGTRVALLTFMKERCGANAKKAGLQVEKIKRELKQGKTNEH